MPRFLENGHIYRAVDKFGDTIFFNPASDMNGEARMIERAFGLGPCGLSEAISMLERTDSVSRSPRKNKFLGNAL